MQPEIQQKIVSSSVVLAPTYQEIPHQETNTFPLYNIISTIGIVAVLGAFIYIGKKLQILDNLKDTSDKTKSNLDVVCRYLMKNHTKFDPSELKTFSPFQLTQEGNNFIKEIGFDNVFEKHKKDFFNFIESENPKLKYDVEELAIKSIFVMYEKSYMAFLKVFFYNKPKRNLENTAPTLGVYIRDKFLEEHPEITQ